MPLGVCKLCREEKELINSHWIAASILKALRAEDLKNPNPVTMGFVITEQTSKQMQEILFGALTDTVSWARTVTFRRIDVRFR
jgi:hypothetical protein